MFARHRDGVGATLCAHTSEARGMMGEWEFQAVDVRGKVDVVAVSMLVDDNTGVIAGHHDVPQDG